MRECCHWGMVMRGCRVMRGMLQVTDVKGLMNHEIVLSLEGDERLN